MEQTRRLIQQCKLSIYALELVVAAAAVRFIEVAGVDPHRKAYVLNCDNGAACAAANYSIASSAAMRKALWIWHDTCAEHERSARLLYIETGSNRISDAPSRGEWRKALAGIEEEGWMKRKLDLDEVLSRWEGRLHAWLARVRIFRSTEQEGDLALKAEEEIEKAEWWHSSGTVDHDE